MLLMNAINWIDGIDGLSTGITNIFALTNFIFSLRVNNILTANISIALFFVTLGYLPYNFPPSKNTMVGFGASLYGLYLAILSILTPSRTPFAIVLLIPIIDLIWVVIGRIMRHKIVNPLAVLKISDTTHIHHRLINMGFTPKQVTLISYLAVTIISISSLIYYGSNYAYLGFLLLGLILIIFIGIDIHINKVKMTLNELNNDKFEILINNKTFANIDLKGNKFKIKFEVEHPDKKNLQRVAFKLVPIINRYLAKSTVAIFPAEYSKLASILSKEYFIIQNDVITAAK